MKCHTRVLHSRGVLTMTSGFPVSDSELNPELYHLRCNVVKFAYLEIMSMNDYHANHGPA